MKLKYKNWNDIPIKTYKKLLSIVNNKELNAVDTELAIIQTLCDCSEEELLNLPIPEYQSLLQDAQFIKIPIDAKAYCPKKIKLDNSYSISYDISKITTAQYIDFQSFTKMNDLDKYLTNILAVFFIPEGKTYGNGYDIEDVINDIDNNLSIVEGLSACFFFLTEWLTLTQITLTSLTRKAKKMKNQTPQTQKMIKELDSMINGVG